MSTISWSELRLKCKRESDYVITLFITNEVSLGLTRFFLKTPITPNQVTITSILCGVFAGFLIGFGFFLTGSMFLFVSHVLDCTDGNLARAKGSFSSSGKWLDMIGDRVTEMFLFCGAGFYLFRHEASMIWSILPLLDAILLLLYYYIVDISLALGLSKSIQTITSLKFKDVRVKWGLLEPMIYGFIVLTPLGLIKVQIVLMLSLTLTGLLYQGIRVSGKRDMEI